MVRTATGNVGADVILDIVGASYLDRNVQALAPGGRLVVIGLQGGLKAELNIGALLSKRGSIIATALRARSVEEKAAIVTAVREHVWPLIGSGLVRPVVHARLPMSEAAQAHEILNASTHIGKVLLTV
jgi:NADPH:quinone reductase-like Zn-dependent oxidoreductase